MTRPNFSNAYLVRAVRQLMTEWNCTSDVAIEGICEGHELPRLQEEYLRDFFSFNQREGEFDRVQRAVEGAKRDSAPSMDDGDDYEADDYAHESEGRLRMMESGGVGQDSEPYDPDIHGGDL